MPELPEVETVRRSLIPTVVGRRIIGLRIADFPGVVGEIDPRSVTESLRDRSILDVQRRAKYLLFVLDNDSLIVVHLRMTGTLTVEDRATPPLRFERLAIELDDGRDLRFADQRKFGRVLHLLPEQWAQVESRLGPEPLDAAFTVAELARRLEQRTGPLKNVLLDQRVIAGLGNIYVDEALFRAKLHPLRNPSSLSDRNVRQLHLAIRTVLADAIANRGTTFSSYSDGAGVAGDNQRFLMVYGRGRQGELCFECFTPIERFVISGRSSHFCPTCQPRTPNNKQSRK